MARDYTDQTNMDAPDGDNPFGISKNESPAGARNGTEVNEEYLHDMWVFFQKLMSRASVAANNLVENDPNTYQYHTALDTVIDLVVQTLQATETKVGAAEIATQAETDAGTDDTRIVTPSKIANATAIIDSQQLVNGSVDNVHLAGLIDGSKLANSTLPSSKVDNSGSTGIAIYTINGFAGAGAPPLGPSGYRGFIWINPTGGTVWTSDNSTWYQLA